MHTNIILPVTNKRHIKTQNLTTPSLVQVPPMPSGQEMKWTYSKSRDPHIGQHDSDTHISDTESFQRQLIWH